MSIKTPRFTAIAIGAAVAATIAGCGGSDHQPSSVFIPPQSLTGGIWRGSVEDAAGAVVGEAFGIVTEGGDFRIVIGTDLDAGADIHYVGTLEGIAGGGVNVVEGTFTGVSMLGGPEICPGATTAPGTITNGDISQRRSLQLDSVLGAACFSPFPTHHFDLTYDSAYGRAANINTPAGSYTDAATGATVTINDAGGIFSQDPASGCVLTGRIAPVDLNFNAYTIFYVLEACLDPDNNGSAEGLATMLDGRNQLFALTSSNAESGGVAMVLVYNRN